MIHPVSGFPILEAWLLATATYCLAGSAMALALGVQKYYWTSFGTITLLCVYAIYGLSEGLAIPSAATLLLGLTIGAGLGALHGIADTAGSRLPETDRPLVLFVISSAGYAIVQNLIMIAVGPQIRAAVRLQRLIDPHLTVMLGIAAAGILIIAGSLLIARTRMGLKIRAVVDDPRLALETGIDVPAVRTVANAVSGLLAGTCAAVLALDQDIRPAMGFDVIIQGTLVAYLAGSIKPVALLGAAVIAASLDTAALLWLPTGLKSLVVGTALVIVLVVRAQIRSRSGLPGLRSF